MNPKQHQYFDVITRDYIDHIFYPNNPPSLDGKSSVLKRLDLGRGYYFNILGKACKYFPSENRTLEIITPFGNIVTSHEAVLNPDYDYLPYDENQLVFNYYYYFKQPQDTHSQKILSEFYKQFLVWERVTLRGKIKELQKRLINNYKCEEVNLTFSQNEFHGEFSKDGMKFILTNKNGFPNYAFGAGKYYPKGEWINSKIRTQLDMNSREISGVLFDIKLPLDYLIKQGHTLKVVIKNKKLISIESISEGHFLYKPVVRNFQLITN